MCTAVVKNDKNYSKICDIKTLFTKPPSKAKVQELKWKSKVNRQSLPVELPELPVQNIIMEVKHSNRRKTESDIDLNIDSYNINPFEMEKIEYSRKKKHKKKCSKSHRRAFVSDKKHKRTSSDDSSFKTNPVKSKSCKKSKKVLSEIHFSNNSEEEKSPPKSPRITKVKLFKQKPQKALFPEVDKPIFTSESVHANTKSLVDQNISVKITKFKHKTKLYDKSSSEVNVCEDTTEINEIEETSVDKIKPKTTKNAFLVMMDARNHVIGSNSDGEEKLDDDSSAEDNTLRKSKLKEKKNFLENWANEKGAKKRKLKEDAREEYVVKTLNRRAKKFKAMFENSKDTISETIPSPSSSDKTLNRRARRSTEKFNLSKTKDADQNLSDSTPKSFKQNDLEDISIPTIDLDGLDVLSSRTLRTRRTVVNYSENPTNDETESVAKSLHDDNKKLKETKKKSVKIAPLFIKKQTPKQDKQTIEAKKNFLQSGLPEQCIRLIEKQKIQENYEYTLFPSVSHVKQCQKFLYTSNAPEYRWNSFRRKLNDIENRIPRSQGPLTLGLFTNCQCSVKTRELNLKPPILYSEPKQIIKEFKKLNPTFPANAIYRKFKSRSNSESESVMWTEKYKPISSEEIIGNTKSMAALKEWLSTWLVNREKKSELHKNGRCDSDFIDSDAESRDSVSGRVNTIVLVGPTGSGKTTAVYAIANDLNINVLEINASSQRNGKRILNDIHEATQSRNFRENLNNCVQLKRCENSTKYSLILIEDIDIVFSVIDDGFLGAINNIIMSGKRPVILTSSDNHAAATQKYMAQHKTLTFHSVSSSIITPWLQIVSIMEGIWPNAKQITELLSLNNGDLRKTLLDLQYLILSGTDVSEKPNNNENITNLRLEKFRNPLAYPLSLNDLYWRLPSACEKSYKYGQNGHNSQSTQTEIDQISFLFDNLALLDVTYAKNELECALNPASCIWKSVYSQLSDSLNVNTNMQMYKNSEKVTYDWTNFLISKSLDLENIDTVAEDLQWKSCSMDKIRLKRIVQTANTKFLDGISLSSHLGPRNLGLDYFPYLRAINRSEAERVLMNSKRGNRFCNYLKCLNIHCSDAQTELLLNSLVT